MRCDQDQSGEGCRYEQSRCKDRIRGLQILLALSKAISPPRPTNPAVEKAKKCLPLIQPKITSPITNSAQTLKIPTQKP